MGIVLGLLLILLAVFLVVLFFWTAVGGILGGMFFGATRRCPGCGKRVLKADAFCEGCGAPVARRPGA